jgi:fermentation-respiration switch protein FrsA (DUF1100 family)
MRLLYLLLLTVPLAACTGVFFQPQQIQYLTPDKIGLVYEDVYFTSSDGVKLHGWMLPARGKARGTVLFLHGNAENISTHIGNVYWLPAQNYNVFLPDYSGYGLSEGVPTVDGVQHDISGAMGYLLKRADIDSERIVILAQSLGGALAIYNVAHSPYRAKIKALISESAFSDYRAITREKLASFWLTWPLQWPLSLTIDNDYSPMPAAHKISPIPLLIIHGDKDNVVPLAHGQALFAAAAEPKEMWIVPGGGHIEALRHKKYQDRLLEYLGRVLPQN